MSGVGKNRFDQARVIKNGVARFRVAQKIDQRNAVTARTGEGANDEIEIGGGKTSPTICPNHRTFRSRALTMPQPTLFEARCISEWVVSQEGLVRWLKGWGPICKGTASPHNKPALFGDRIKLDVDFARMEGW